VSATKLRKRVLGIQGTVRVVVAAAALMALLALAGCSGGSASGTGTQTPGASGSTASTTTAGKGAGMGGISQPVVIAKSALMAKPKPWDLRTPQSAVRSYLDWTAYAYRVAQSDVATPVMSAAEEVRVDSYNQLNLEKSRVMDETLVSLKFGAPSTEGTRVVLPAHEVWTYRYVSIAQVGRTVGGPYPATFDSVYTLVKTGKGWVVDSVKAKAIGAVK